MAEPPEERTSFDVSRRVLLRANVAGIVGAGSLTASIGSAAAETVATVDVPLAESVELTATVDADVTSSSGGTVDVLAGDVELYSFSCTAPRPGAGCAAEVDGETVTADVSRHAGETIDVAYETALDGRTDVDVSIDDVDASDPVEPIDVSLSGRTSPEVDQEVTYEATVSGGSGPVEYGWAVFRPDPFRVEHGAPDSSTKDHEFSSTGDWVVSVQVSDETGTAGDTLDVTVEGPPIDVSLSGPTRAPAGELVEFDASSSSAGSVDYDWTVEGPRTQSPSGDGDTLEHEFPEIGEWTVSVRATDQWGSATDDLTVNVPGEAIDVTLTGDTDVTEAQSVEYVADATSIGNVEYSWAVYYGDDTSRVDYGAPDSPTYEREFSGPGTWYVAVRATDQWGTAGDRLSVTVTEPDVSVELSGRTDVRSGEELTYEASISPDVDAEYGWVAYSTDPERVEYGGPDDPTYEYEFSSTGQHHVSVQASHDWGTNTDTLDVSVSGIGLELSGPTDPAVEDGATYEATVDDPVGDVTYEWDVEAPLNAPEPELDPDGDALDATFAAAGEYEVSVTATDDVDSHATDQTVTVGGGLGLSLFPPEDASVGETATCQADVDVCSDVAFDWAIRHEDDDEPIPLDSDGSFVSFEPERTGLYHARVEAEGCGLAADAIEAFAVAEDEPLVDLSVADAELVQVAADTRVVDRDPDEGSTEVLYEVFDGAPLVLGRRTIALLDLDAELGGEVSWSEVLSSDFPDLSDTEFEVTVDGEEHTTFFFDQGWRPVGGDPELPALLSANYDFVDAIAERGVVEPFVLDASVDEVRVSMTHEHEDVEGSEVVIDVPDPRTDLEYTDPEEFHSHAEGRVYDVPELRVAIVTTEDRPEYESVPDAVHSHVVDETASFLQSVFPVDEVDVRHHEERIEPVDPDGDKDHEDDARIAHERATDVSPTDVTVLLVDDGYFDAHGREIKGHAVWGDETAVVAERYGDVEKTIEVVAHEIAHHFADDAYRYPEFESNAFRDRYPLAQRRSEGDGNVDEGDHIDYDHARSFDSPSPFDDDVGVLSTSFDLYDYDDATLHPGAHSVLSYDDDALRRADEPLVRGLVHAAVRGDGAWTPKYGDSQDGPTEDRIVGVLDLDAEVGVEVGRLDRSPGYPMRSADDGDLVLRALDDDGTVLDERVTSPEQWTHGASTGPADDAWFALRCPGDACRLEVEHDGDTATFSPDAEYLATLLDRVPEDAFEGDADDLRTELLAIVEDVGHELLDGAYEDAFRLLDGEFRTLLYDFVTEDADSDSASVTRSDVTEAVDEEVEVSPDPVTVELDGERSVEAGATAEYAASVSGASGDVSFTWERKHSADQRPSALDVDGSAAELSFPTEGTYALMVTAETADGTAYDGLTVSVDDGDVDLDVSAPDEATVGDTVTLEADAAGCDDVAFSWSVRHPGDDRVTPTSGDETLSMTVDTAGTYDVQAVVEGCGATASDAVVLVVEDAGPCPADAGATTVDGQTVCDLNDDGYYRDVTGDGSVGQGDVAEFFGKQHREAWKRPELFDFSGNGDVTHGDVVELADYVALN